MAKLHSDCRDFGASVATPTEISSVTRFEGHAFGVESVTLERDGKRFVRDIVNYSALKCRASRRFRSRFALQRGMSPTARRKQS